MPSQLLAIFKLLLT